MDTPIRNKVFISYSHEDKKWLSELNTHLSPLLRRNIITSWDDTQLKAGDEWKVKVEAALATAKVAVLLVTPDFLASRFIAEEELPPLLEAARKEGVAIFWIAVSPSNYWATPIAKYQAANAPAHPLSTFDRSRRDQEWVKICNQIADTFNAPLVIPQGMEVLPLPLPEPEPIAPPPVEDPNHDDTVFTLISDDAALDDLLLQGGSVDADFMQLYITSTSAYERGDKDTSMRTALELYKLARNNVGNLPSHRSDEVGNLGLRAEQLRRYDFADALFQLALYMKPTHANNMQHYISFILDTARRERYELTGKLLRRLESPEHKDHRPERTLRLRAQWAEATDQPFALSDAQKQELVYRVSTQARDFGVYSSAMLLATEVAKSPELMLQLFEASLSDADSVTYVYRRLRGLADSLTDFRSKIEIRQQAMEIYRRLLQHPEWIGEAGVNAVVHNYATLMYVYDYKEEAGRLWHRVYLAAPNDSQIQSAYAGYLITAKAYEQARKVQAGELLEGEPVLQKQAARTPEQFSDAPYIDRAFVEMERQAALGNLPSAEDVG